ncbi:MAG: carboxypeptidase M32 [Holdemanella sp.]|nr:carboxypeptidase M32 [Holdemanella sp.]
MKFEPFYEKYIKTIQAFQLAVNTISFEQMTIAPKKGVPYSNEMLAILQTECFQVENNPETIQKMQDYLKTLDSDSLEYKEVFLRLQKISDTQTIPNDEYQKYMKLRNDSMMVWHEAKASNDYESFKPYLKNVVETTLKISSYSNRFNKEKAYDYLLDQYEKGMTEEKYDIFFSKVKEKIIPLIKKVNQSPYTIDDALLHVRIDEEKQDIFMKSILKFLQADPGKVFLSTTEHPFTSSFSPADARITTHYYPDRFLSAILSTVHEYGHALYGLQVDEDYAGTMFYDPYCAAHESQSRFLENHIGRSKGFWKAILPSLKEQFEEFKDVTLEELYEMINKSECGLIRTEADELTYPLHILIRYELEKEMVNGTMDYDKLPELWADKYESYLQVRPATDTEGVLQDIHWSDGSFGYFPSYALGSAYAAQIYATMVKEIDVDEVLQSHRFEIVTDWLKENVHKYGASLSMEEIVEKVTKEPFNPDYYINYLTEKYTKLYKL